MQNPCDGLRGPDYRPEQRAQLYPEVAGKIDNVTDPVNKSYLFTDKQLLAMPVRSITTSTSRRHRENSKGFRWPISQARRRQGRDADLLRAERLLHRRAAVRRQKVQHDHGLQDGRGNAEAQKLRPAVLVYPRDAAGPELNSPLYNSRFIWQVDRIVIK